MHKEENSVEGFLKKCDIYRKLPKDTVEASTSGATISLITVIVIFLLCLSELSSYMTPQLVSDLQVDVSKTAE